MGNYNWDDYLTTYGENGGFFVNDSYGNPTEVGDFAAFANYQVTGTYGDFNTSTDPGAYGMNFLVESYGGVFVETSEASDQTVEELIRLMFTSSVIITRRRQVVQMCLF